MRRLRDKLTYANVMSTLCFFLVVSGGAAYAAGQLGKNSVGTKQLKNNAVVTAKIKKEAVTGAKVKKGTLTGKNINLAKLGTVPSATHAASADSIPLAEPTHFVGAPGQPGFENGAENDPIHPGGLSLPQVGFYRDAFGIVHLEGLVKIPATGVAFILPAGFRPATGTRLFFEPSREAPVVITGSAGGPLPAGAVVAGAKEVVLNGITYRAGS